MVSIDPVVEEQVRAHIASYRSQGYSDGQIKQALLKSAVDPVTAEALMQTSSVTPFVGSQHSGKKFALIIVAVVLLFLIGLAVYASFTSSPPSHPSDSTKTVSSTTSPGSTEASTTETVSSGSSATCASNADCPTYLYCSPSSHTCKAQGEAGSSVSSGGGPTGSSNDVFSSMNTTETTPETSPEVITSTGSNETSPQIIAPSLSGLGEDCSRGSDCESAICSSQFTCGDCVSDFDCTLGYTCETVTAVCYASSTCASDSGCGSGESCTDGSCVASVLCENDSTCDAYTCDSLTGTCSTECSELAYTCATGYACQYSTGDCIADTDGDGSPDFCYDTTDCRAVQACDSTGVCSADLNTNDIADIDEAASCDTTDSDCSPYEELTLCETIADCSLGQICSSYVCYISECSDSVDNDNDGLTDYGTDLMTNDPDCDTTLDDSEASKAGMLTYAPEVTQGQGFFVRIWAWILSLFGVNA